MLLFLDYNLNAAETIIFIGVTAFSAAVVFLGWLWYAGLDRQTQAFDEDIRGSIKEGSEFSGIREAADPHFVVSSDTRMSKFISRVKVLLGSRSEKPYKIVPVDEDVMEPRKIEMIRQRVRSVPGRNILGEDLVGAIRNFYAYNLALSEEGVDSEIVEYFESNLEAYEGSRKVRDLAQSDNYDDIALVSRQSEDSDKDPLNDVFLPLVSAAEQHCVRQAPDLETKREHIERCRGVLKLSLYLLWIQRMKGAEVSEGMTTDECLDEYRSTVREGDPWGYWLLPREPCEMEEFRRLRHLVWKIDGILAEYWEDDEYSKLHPLADSIRDMEYAETPFAIFQKEDEDIRGGGPGASA